MSKLRFSDGMEFDTSGPLRTTHREDGWYVVGEGYLIPVNSHEDGRIKIAEMRTLKRIADHIDGYDRDNLGESPDY